MVRIVHLASKVSNCNENGCSTSGIHKSDFNMIDHATSLLECLELRIWSSIKSNVSFVISLI